MDLQYFCDFRPDAYISQTSLFKDKYTVGSLTEGRMTKGRNTKGRMTAGRMTKGISQKAD